MNEIKYLSLFLIVCVALVNPVNAVCIENKVSVYTNIQDSIVTIKTSDDYGFAHLWEGETWDIEDGYTLKLQSVDLSVEPRTITIVFSNNGSVLEEKTVIMNGNSYGYRNIFSAIPKIIEIRNYKLVKFEYIYFLGEPYLWWHPQSGITSMKFENEWFWESNYINFNEEKMWKVSFENIDGYLTPVNETETVSEWNCIEFIGIYRGADIEITSNIPEASFIVSGPEGYSKSGSGETWNDDNIMGGTYNVTFMNVSGYITPIAQAKYITPGIVAYFSAIYSATTPTPSTSPTPASTSSTSKPSELTFLQTPTSIFNIDFIQLLILAVVAGSFAILAAYIGKDKKK
ncbi:MAG: hypothetical protein KAT05_01980 [Spirochaetes bacterium]|nr:hypothetical protein [Spirochaetota bacterium]